MTRGMLRGATPSTTIKRNMPAPTGPVSRIPGGDTTTGQKTLLIMTRTVTFGQGGRTCLQDSNVTTNDSMKGLDGNTIQTTKQKFDIEVCIATCSKKGERVKQKVFVTWLGCKSKLESGKHS
jgi:hypothetical protein